MKIFDSLKQYHFKLELFGIDFKTLSIKLCNFEEQKILYDEPKLLDVNYLDC